MRQLLIFIALTSLNAAVFAQIPTLDEVENFRTMKLFDLQKSLEKKNWKFTNSKKQSNGQVSSVLFTYVTDKTVATLIYYECDLGTDCNRIYIALHEKKQADEYISRLSEKGYKLLKSKIEDGGLEYIYQSNEFTCISKTGTMTYDGRKIPEYAFTFMDNFTYTLIYESN